MSDVFQENVFLALVLILIARTGGRHTLKMKGDLDGS